uniref:Bm10417 n=1 Tax=Brugia malayi TaxID=6279 RepID=A0A0J9XXZ1_BRUMA|nr:Bm10417 [Brugia malayi]
MTSNAQKKREYFLRNAEMSLSVPIRRKWYRKVPAMDFQKNTAQGSCSDLRMSTTSNQLIGAVATWHSIHASLMKLGLSSDYVSSGKVMKASSKSSTSSSSRYSTDSFISYISDDSLNGNQTSDESLDDEKLFNCRPRLSVSNLELRSSQLKEMFPGLSEHWRLQEQAQLY